MRAFAKIIYGLWVAFWVLGLIITLSIGHNATLSANLPIFLMLVPFPLFPYWSYKLYQISKVSQTLGKKIFFISSSMLFFGLFACVLFGFAYNATNGFRFEDPKSICFLGGKKVDCEEQLHCLKTYGSKTCHEIYEQHREQEMQELSREIKRIPNANDN